MVWQPLCCPSVLVCLCLRKKGPDGYRNPRALLLAWAEVMLGMMCANSNEGCLRLDRSTPSPSPSALMLQHAGLDELGDAHNFSLSGL